MALVKIAKYISRVAKLSVYVAHEITLQANDKSLKLRENDMLKEKRID